MGDIAIQGSKALVEPSTQLITGASGDYKGFEGYVTLTKTVNDKHEDIFKYYISFGTEHGDWMVSS